MELDFVAWLREQLPPSPAVRIGVGDDAALIGLRRPELVATADLLIDGTHFLTAEHAPERIGRKALAVNLSDLAAMAARPVGALVSLALPSTGACGLPASDLAKRLVEGMLPLAEEFGCPVVGGDTNTTAGPLVVAVTAFGEPTDRGVVTRSGALPGDVLCVTGPLGGSLAGKHLDFTPRVAEALSLHAEVDLHAMMDLSDGLSLDLGRMCDASGVGATIVADNTPIAKAAGGDLQRALSDGEDFELLVAMPEQDAARLHDGSWVGETLHRIGTVTEARDLLVRQSDGTLTPLRATGYEHR